MLDWLNANAPAVQAIATVALCVLTGFYVRFTKRQAEAMQEQLETAREGIRQQKETYESQARGAVRAILVELRGNAISGQRPELEATPPMLAVQYSEHAWALVQSGAKQSTIDAIVCAYIAIEDYRAAREAAFLATGAKGMAGAPKERTRVYNMWEPLEARIEEALKSIASDSAISPLLPSSVPEGRA